MSNDTADDTAGDAAIGTASGTASDVTTIGGADGQGFRAPQVCKIVGITYRQLDYWARTDLLVPSLQTAQGSGSQRLYSFQDVVQLRVVKRLLDAGMSLKKIRTAMDLLREQLQSDSPLSDVTLLSNGTTIFAAHSADEVVDVFRHGQGVFGIAVGPVQAEIEGEIHRLFPDEGENAGVIELAPARMEA